MAFSTLGLKITKATTNAYGEKIEQPQSSPRNGKPSDKLNPKTVDPFNTKDLQKSAFGIVYSNGGIPCRLMHGSVKNRLTWNTPPDMVPFDPVLVTLAQGLKETVHPFNFVAHQGFVELISVRDADQKALQVLPKLVVPIKNALVCENDAGFMNALDALVHLSETVGPALNPHLKNFLSILSKRVTQRKYRDLVTDALNAFEKNGGKEVLPIIKTKIPTYNCIT